MTAAVTAPTGHPRDSQRRARHGVFRPPASCDLQSRAALRHFFLAELQNPKRPEDQVLTSTDGALSKVSGKVRGAGTRGASPVTYTNTSATNTQQFYRIQSP